MNPKPKMMITGAGGFVGTRVREACPSVIPVDSGLLQAPGQALTDLITAHRPDVIVNAAAISDIGTCEKHPEESYQANVLLPALLAKVSEELGIKLISFSSDQVYTGCRKEGPYREDMLLPEPQNVYARHKLEAEQRVLELCPGAVLLRATWMYDMPVYGHANRGNFLVNTLDAVLQGRPISVPVSQHRGITYVRQVVRLLEQVVDLPGGIYNYGSENPLNMAETAQALLDALGLEGCVQDTGQKRHDLWMDCGKLRKHGICFDTTAGGFRRCAEDYGLRR